MLRIILALVVLGLLVSPLAAAQEDDDDYTHLYGHVYGVMREGSGYANNIPNPINTQAPIGENDYSRGGGSLAVHAPAVPAPCVADSGTPVVRAFVGSCDLRYDLLTNEVWFSLYNALTPWSGFEEFWEVGGYEVLTGERTLLKDLRFDETLPITTTLYMAADATAWFPWFKGCIPLYATCPIEDMLGDDPMYQDIPWPYPMWNSDYGVFPNWVVTSRIFAVDPGLMATNATEMMHDPNTIVDAETSDQVTLLGDGASDPFDMYSLPTQVPGGQIVYGFEADLGPALEATVPSEKGIFWWVDWHGLVDRNDPDTQVLWGTNFAVNSGEFYPPKLSLPITNPMDIEMVMPQFTDDNKLVIIALFNSPFGAYDVPLDSASFELVGPDGSVIATQDDDTVTWMQKAAREQQSLLGVSPEAALKRGQATWLWNYLAEEDITPGDYTIRVRAENMQGKAAFKEAYFTIEEGLGKGAVTSSLGGMFTFSKEDIKKLEECHGCHDAATGDLLEGVQNVTMAEAKEMMESGELDTSTGNGGLEKKSPGLPLSVLVGALLILRRKRP